jgi:hypothetical protein
MSQPGKHWPLIKVGLRLRLRRRRRAVERRVVRVMEWMVMRPTNHYALCLVCTSLLGGVGALGFGVWVWPLVVCPPALLLPACQRKIDLGLCSLFPARRKKPNCGLAGIFCRWKRTPAYRCLREPRSVLEEDGGGVY